MEKITYVHIKMKDQKKIFNLSFSLSLPHKHFTFPALTTLPQCNDVGIKKSLKMKRKFTKEIMCDVDYDNVCIWKWMW